MYQSYNTRRRTNPAKVFFAWLAAVAVALLCLFGIRGCANGVGERYSEGDRTGVVVKISRKGFFFKSWEAEMNVGGVSASEGGIAVPRTWEFSVTDPKVVEQIRQAAAEGRRVTVVYTQWALQPITQDTAYNAREVK